MATIPDTGRTDIPTDSSKEDYGPPEPVVGEKSELEPLGKARAILVSTLVVLTQLVQVSRLPCFSMFAYVALTNTALDDSIRGRHKWLLGNCQSDWR